MMTKNSFGQGEAWCFAGSLGYSAYKTGYCQTMELLADPIDGVGLSRWLEVDTPPTVEVSVERDTDGVLYPPRQQNHATASARERQRSVG